MQGLAEGEDWVKLGDEVLVRVTAAMVYGGKRPALLSLPPVGGYTKTSVSKSVAQVRSDLVSIIFWTDKSLRVQVILSIQELGQGVLNSSDGNLALLSQVKEWETKSKALLVLYKKSNPKGWDQFSQSVHTYAKVNAVAEIMAVNEVDLSGSGIRFCGGSLAEE